MLLYDIYVYTHIYNYIIVIIKYDVDHCGSNFFICGASLGIVIEMIRDKVKKEESNWVRACSLGSATTMDREKGS